MDDNTELLNEVIDGRQDVYGDPAVQFPMVAKVWSGILGTEVRPDQVALLLMGYKLVRTSACPTYSDNSDDIEGYLDIFRTVVGEDMVHARSVSEYLEKKEAMAKAVEMAEHSGPVSCTCTERRTTGEHANNCQLRTYIVLKGGEFRGQ